MEKTDAVFMKMKSLIFCVISAEEAENVSSMHIFYLGMYGLGQMGWEGGISITSETAVIFCKNIWKGKTSEQNL